MFRKAQNECFQVFFVQGSSFLHLHYDIVQKHGGKLTVESELDVGTVFKISLPVKYDVGVDEPPEGVV